MPRLFAAMLLTTLLAPFPAHADAGLADATKQLFAVAELKLDATALGLRKLDLGPTGGRVTFTPKPAIDPMAVIRLIQGQPKVYSMDGPDKLRLRMDLPDAASRLRTARGLLAMLSRGDVPGSPRA